MSAMRAWTFGVLSVATGLKLSGEIPVDASNATSSGAAHKFAKHFKHFVKAAEVAEVTKPVQDIPTGAPVKSVHLRAQSKATSAVGTRKSKARVSTSGEEEEEEGCGALTSFPNAKPKDYRNARKTKYDTAKKKQVDVTFAAGDTVEFECEKGFTVDGALDGDTVFDVDCLDKGYYEPKGTCLKASKCGSLPEISHAAPTGKTKTGGKVEFACMKGFSLDGEKVVEGGEGHNSHFDLKCIEFKGEYEEFRGECSSYMFMPAHEVTAMYNQVFEALFEASCKSTLKKDFGKSGEPPAGLDSACAKIKIGDSSKCDDLVKQIKDDFKTKKGELDSHNDEEKEDWFEEKSDAPNVNDEAHKFCSDLFEVLRVQTDEK